MNVSLQYFFEFMFNPIFEKEDKICYEISQNLNSKVDFGNIKVF